METMENQLEKIDKRTAATQTALQKLTIDVEEESHSFTVHYLKEHGILIPEVTTLQLTKDFECNIYGANDEYCVIGEAALRGGKSLYYELQQKVEKLREEYPEYLRKKIIRVLYVSLPLPELVEIAKNDKIWLLKATKEFVPLVEVLQSL